MDAQELISGIPSKYVGSCQKSSKFAIVFAVFVVLLIMVITLVFSGVVSDGGKTILTVFMVIFGIGVVITGLGFLEVKYGISKKFGKTD